MHTDLFDVELTGRDALTAASTFFIFCSSVLHSSFPPEDLPEERIFDFPPGSSIQQDYIFGCIPRGTHKDMRFGGY